VFAKYVKERESEKEFRKTRRMTNYHEKKKGEIENLYKN
jgi:hypothetical protein